MSRSLAETTRRLLPSAVAFAVGLVLMGYSATAVLTTAYMRASPAVGDVSTSAGFGLVALLLFGLGAVVAFLAAGAALYRVREDAG